MKRSWNMNFTPRMITIEEDAASKLPERFTSNVAASVISDAVESSHLHNETATRWEMFAATNTNDFSLEVPKTHKSENTVFNMLKLIFNPQPETYSGRRIQYAWVIFLSLLMFATIAVQIFDEVEDMMKRNEDYKTSTNARKIIDISLNINQLIVKEMEVSFEYYQEPYAIWQKQTELAMRRVDEQLLMVSIWFDDNVLATVPEELRANVSSPSALRNAILEQREQRKFNDGLEAEEMVMFYERIIHSLTDLIDGLAFMLPRVTDWQDLIAVAPATKSFISFKKHAVLIRRYISENGSQLLPRLVFKSAFEEQIKYFENLEMAYLMSAAFRQQIANFTELQLTKDLNQHFAEFNFTHIDRMEFWEKARQHDKNMEYMITEVRKKAASSEGPSSLLWNDIKFISVPLISLAIVIAFAAAIVHIIKAYVLQNHIIHFYEVFKELQGAGQLPYNYVPKDLISGLLPGEKKAILRSNTDTALLAIDIVNLPDLTNENASLLVEKMEAAFTAIDTSFLKYNIFKAVVGSGYFIYGTGVGEHHMVDHVAELMYAAMAVFERIAHINQVILDDDISFGSNIIQFRMGMHLGPCQSQVVHFTVPHVAIVGNIMHALSVIHATAIPGKIQTSAEVAIRVAGVTSDFDFVNRGEILLPSDTAISDQKEESATPLRLFWAQWAENNFDREDDNWSAAS